MNPTPFASFLRFLIGFMLFISISFGVTFAVNSYTSARDEAQQAAAAEALMLQQK